MTTWKFREDGQEKRTTIDYIFLSDQDSLIPTHVRMIPTALQVGPKGLPCRVYPSDHFSLAARLVWGK